MHSDPLDRLLITLAVRLHAFSVCQIQQGWRLAFSPFEAITIHYVLRGMGSLRVKQEPWLPFVQHSIIVIPARQSHTIGEAMACAGEAQAADQCGLHGDGLIAFRAGDAPDTVMVCGQISASYDGALGLFELFQAPMIGAFSVDSALHRSFELMLAEVTQPGLGTQAMTEVLMKQCLIILLRQQLLGDTAGTSPMLMALREPRLARAVLAILEQPGVPYTVERLASLAGMSRASFADLFSRIFEQAPMDFVQRVRLRIAARLLGGTDLPVKVIAGSVGYASRSSFSRAFEGIYGAAPADFRKSGNQDEAAPDKARRHPVPALLGFPVS